MDSLQDQVARTTWFHSIDFGDFASSGRFKPGSRQNITLYGPFELMQAMDLSRATVLDLGTADGIVAFGLAALGAEKVVAADTHDLPTFRLARQALGYRDRIEYYPGVQISAMESYFRRKQFDLINCCGILYHMLHPQQAFSEVRKFIKDGGYLVLETPYQPDEERAVLFFNPTEVVANEATTYYVPSRSALLGMAGLGGFQVVAIRPLEAPARLCLLLRAATREELIEDETTTPMLKQILKRDLVDDEFRFAALEKLPHEPANISLGPIEFERVVRYQSEDVTWPHHPPLDKPAFGRTRWETETGNNKIL